jgi:hypothetical protein
VAGSCGRGNESWASVKVEEFLDQLRDYQLLDNKYFSATSYQSTRTIRGHVESCVCPRGPWRQSVGVVSPVRLKGSHLHRRTRMRMRSRIPAAATDEPNVSHSVNVVDLYPTDNRLNPGCPDPGLQLFSSVSLRMRP